MNNNLTVRIFKDINDPELKNAWITLQQESNTFPQMYYEWISPWYRYSLSKKSLYVVAVEDNDNKIVGLAPLCLMRKYGVKILQSIPVHFGDYYSFIVLNNAQEVFDCIIEHINTFKSWHYIKINLVRENSEFYNVLLLKKYLKQQVDNIIVSDFKNITYDKYLMLLHRKVRGEYRRRLRKLENLGCVDFSISSDPETYIKYAKDFREIYEQRWKEIDKKMPGNNVYAYRREALISLSEQKKAVFVLLKLDGKLIAYRFGIIHKDKYHDYKISFNPKYQKYGLGSILTGLLIEKLIEKNIKYLDHGVGDYSYKKDWSPNGKILEVNNFHYFKGNLLAKLYYMFETKYKAILKKLLKR